MWIVRFLALAALLVLGPAQTTQLTLTGAGIGGGPAPVLWTPANYTGTIAWWDANSGLSLTGSSVNSWTDQVGGIVALPGVAPGYSATARNGTPGLTFDGSSQHLAFSPTGLPAGNTARAIAIGGYAVSTGGNFAISYGLNNAGNFFAVLGSTTSPFAVQGYDGITPVTATEDWGAVDRFVLFSLNGSGVGTMDIDGNPDENFSFTTNTILSLGYIGAYIAANNTWNGVIQQIVVTNSYPSANTKACLAGWESWYDGKAGSNLPVGSPYKSRPPYTTDPC